MSKSEIIYEKPSIAFSAGFDPPPPKYVYTPIPNFSKRKHPELDERRYWATQNDRWINGYDGPYGHVSGMHYFYIQECVLQDINGNDFHPEWRDVDELIFKWCADCMRDEQSLLIYKRREVGATSIFANLAFWFMRLYPGCRIGLTSGKGQSGISAMFNEKILHSYNRFNKKVLNTTPVQINNTRQKTSLEVALKVYDKKGKSTSDKISTLICRETDENPSSPTNLSGGRNKYIYNDEAPLHKRMPEFLDSVFPVMMRGTKREGFMVMAGTVEPNLTNEQVMAFQKLVTDSKDFNVRTEMLPVWMGLVTKNGYSDKEAGLKWWYDQYSVFEQSGNLRGQRAWKMQYPRDEQDIFEISRGGVFEEDVEDTLKQALAEVKEHESRHKFIEMGGRVIRQPHHAGPIYLIEEPKKGITYYQCIDGMGTGTLAGSEKGSNAASIIFKGVDKGVDYDTSFTPVCIYYDRPGQVEETYRYFKMQHTYYNVHGGLKKIYFETNAGTGEHFQNYMIKLGLQKHLAHSVDLSGKGNINVKKVGQGVTKETIDFQVKQANLFLRKYGYLYSCSPLLLNDLLKPESENADLRSAFFVFMVPMKDFDKPAKKKQEIEFRTVHQLVIDQAGNRVWQSKKVPLQNPNVVFNPIGNYERHTEAMHKKYGHYWYNRMQPEERAMYFKLRELAAKAEEPD